jgi:hypothetical protein
LLQLQVNLVKLLVYVQEGKSRNECAFLPASGNEVLLGYVIEKETDVDIGIIFPMKFEIC